MKTLIACVVFCLVMMLACSAAVAAGDEDVCCRRPMVIQPQLVQPFYAYSAPAPPPIAQRFNPYYVDGAGTTWVPRRVGLFGWQTRWYPIPPMLVQPQPQQRP